LSFTKTVINAFVQVIILSCIVLSAMATKGTSHVDPQFINTFGESLELLRKVFLTRDAQPFIVAGSGTLGWDMAVCNLMEPGDEALIINTGYFGDHFGKCVEAYGFKTTHVHAPIGDRPSLEAVGKALEAKCSTGKPFKLCIVTHVDTSTGVLQDIKGVSETVRAKSPSSLLVVDGVCSIGAEELRMDDWGVDVALTASQKAIGTPAGLCILLASQRAIKSFESRKSPVVNYFGSCNPYHTEI
jgi:alanine-glyoxylate transaminase / serine-glyoxylate transaminase / serine-pyruvate transaminase